MGYMMKGKSLKKSCKNCRRLNFGEVHDYGYCTECGEELYYWEPMEPSLGAKLRKTLFTLGKIEGYEEKSIKPEPKVPKPPSGWTISDNWKQLKETIMELRDNAKDGTSEKDKSQYMVCYFLVNYMEVLEKELRR